MDNLTQLKKNRLLQESKDKILETPLFHNDIMKMYAYISTIVQQQVIH